MKWLFMFAFIFINTLAAAELACSDIISNFEASKKDLKRDCKEKKGDEKKICKANFKEQKKQYKDCKKLEKAEKKKVNCLAKDKLWIEKKPGKFQCVKKSKITKIENIGLVPGFTLDQKKFTKCRKLWEKMRKKISGEYIKVKHLKKLEKKGCIKIE